MDIANKKDALKMGLNNKICEHPTYWCRLHQVWLDDEDVKKKKCQCKPTFDMLGVVVCNSLKKAEEVTLYHELYGQKGDNHA